MGGTILLQRVKRAHTPPPLNLDTFRKDVKVAAAVKIMLERVLCLWRSVWLPVECKVCALTARDKPDNGARGRGLRG